MKRFVPLRQAILLAILAAPLPALAAGDGAGMTPFEAGQRQADFGSGRSSYHSFNTLTGPSYFVGCYCSDSTQARQVCQTKNYQCSCQPSASVACAVTPAPAQ